MTEIVPAIIARDIEEVKKKLALIEGAAEWAQIDVMDGVFTPPVSFNDPATLRDIETAVRLEAHLMVAHPEAIIDAWVDSPVARILFHYESTTPDALQLLIKRVNGAGKEVGIALKLETPVFVLDDFLHAPRSTLYVQLMGIAEIGYHGHPFDERVLEKIRALHERYPDVIIAVDGGVNERTIPLIFGAGATRFIAGSAIYASNDPRKTIKTFKEITQ